MKEILKEKWWLLLIGALGVFLLLASGNQGTEQKRQTDLDAYRKEMETSLTALCEGVRGVGEANVLLTLAYSDLNLYEKNQTATAETVATAGGDAILSGYAFPTVKGVAVVCEGGGDPLVQRELVSLLAAALDLKTNQIHVSPAK